MTDVDSYYTINSENYNNLIKKLDPLIRECLTEENILIQSVQSRIKDRDSFKDKIARRNYAEPNLVKDLLGIRVICYVNSDVRKIVDILHDNFDVSEVEDKSEGLGINVVGYKAIHLICSLPKQRCDLPEFSKFRSSMFEIQVGTILAHAWAEIEHDKIYKLKDNFPDSIKRRLTILSGTLEICDNEFGRISDEVKEYTNDIDMQIQRGSFDIPINVSNLRAYMTIKFKDLPTFKPRFGTLLANETIETFEWLNFRTLKDFDEIIPSDFIERMKKLSTPRRGINIARLVTIIFIIHNTEDFFNVGWRNRFDEFDSYDHLVFEEFKIDMNNFPDKIEFDCSGM